MASDKTIKVEQARKDFAEKLLDAMPELIATDKSTEFFTCFNGQRVTVKFSMAREYYDGTFTDALAIEESTMFAAERKIKEAEKAEKATAAAKKKAVDAAKREQKAKETEAKKAKIARDSEALEDDTTDSDSDFDGLFEQAM